MTGGGAASGDVTGGGADSGDVTGGGEAQLAAHAAVEAAAEAERTALRPVGT